ncbi:uracil-xanthine permease [Anaeromyxobacter sp. K]|uniref:Uracil-xanthine permease n=1 Tax=Anaeromyxobacter dehalogenans (strain ATCC BAA-258 / DSM 21875 / 2CP-1) TaxID=455488 RepID=B8J7T7_ANAD2|nr:MULTISPECIES: uracil permease [Anaeromyxobacter]ACG71301.1 uracil-xanthine permease [Anaeromyxobacter sp. K]ACL63429.1 uracil-xanthine permease [Anaeromyxobacter dehalogenans 2CP-1]
MKRTVDVGERLPLLQSIPLSLQHLFAMFGATVLVPFLVGLDTSVTLFTSGVGTLVYIFITKGKIPAYLGSSFAFIAALSAIIGVAPGQAAPADRVAVAMGGCVAVGVCYLVVAALIAKFGTGWIDRLLPPVVIGSVVMVIGLGLARVAVVNMAMNGGGPTYRPEFFAVALASLAIAILAAVFLKGFLGVIPVLIGIVGGYVVALLAGQVDLSGVAAARPLAVPPFVLPRFTWAAIITLAPISLVVITEHIGHLIVTNNVVGRDFVKDPGLHRSLAGDGVATMISGALGGPPNTTYGENIGVMAITRVFSVWVIGGAAVLAVLMSFLPPVGALIRSIPTQVMGGICILLFGIIASAGIRMLVEAGIDFSQKRNLIIASVVLVIGVGGAEMHFGSVKIDAMPLATYVGILLNLVLPRGMEGTAANGAVAEAPDV